MRQAGAFAGSSSAVPAGRRAAALLLALVVSLLALHLWNGPAAASAAELHSADATGAASSGPSQHASVEEIQSAAPRAVAHQGVCPAESGAGGQCLIANPATVLFPAPTGTGIPVPGPGALTSPGGNPGLPFAAEPPSLHRLSISRT
ncbi:MULTISPECIES: hypothetical protein [Micrococcaceae]|jgi:hypothetical protein|nr:MULTISPECIES: hypothetical protein [Micrococcaceae]ABM10503.1 hypothetical protein AAur_pTC10186 [Paenarthrobacter aurescens TC1]SDQ03205.1 hypothetical protein SAMN04489742_0042 [Arthrobacter crystallopoietes]